MSSTWSLVTTVKAPDELVERFIHHYISLGVTKMYIFLDSPIDQNIHNKLNDDRVVFFLCDDKFWKEREHFHPLRYKKGERSDYVEYRQYHNLLHASSICRTEWLLHVDIDELLFPMNSIEEELSYIPINVFSVLIRPLEAVYLNKEPESLADTLDTRYFKSRRKVDYNFWNGIYPDVGMKNKSGFFGHVTGKSFIRTSENIFRPSCHLPVPMNETFSHGFVLNSMFILHFEAMTRPLFVQKMINRAGKVYNTPFLDEVSKIRTKYLTDRYVEGGEESLREAYLAMHVFDEEKMSKCLQAGFVVNIDNQQVTNANVINSHGDILSYSVQEDMVKAVPEAVLDNASYIPIRITASYDSSECFISFIQNGKASFIGSDRDGVPRKSRGNIAQVFGLSKDKSALISIKFGFNGFKNEDSKSPRFLTANKSGSVAFAREVIKDWEKFTIS